MAEDLMTPEQKRELLNLVRATYQDGAMMAEQQIERGMLLGNEPITREGAERLLKNERERARKYLKGLPQKMQALFKHQHDLIRALNGLDVERP